VSNDDRRVYPRLDLSVPLSVQKIDVQSERESPPLTTMTANISAGGVYFNTLQGEDFKPGMRVELKISMPHHSVPVHKMASFSLVGKGTVLRIDSPLEPGELEEEILSGVAVQFDESLRFENFQLV